VYFFLSVLSRLSLHVCSQVHGATYTVDCEFRCEDLVPGLNWVVDIGTASATLNQVLKQYNFKNLDDIPQFAGENTTTEFMCREVFKGMAEKFRSSFVGEIKVTIAESRSAWASYTGSVGEGLTRL
jgi:6-pyruvoyltetrahydropterin/6-carboxytetrahydropterin synthase